MPGMKLNGPFRKYVAKPESRKMQKREKAAHKVSEGVRLCLHYVNALRT